MQTVAEDVLLQAAQEKTLLKLTSLRNATSCVQNSASPSKEPVGFVLADTEHQTFQHTGYTTMETQHRLRTQKPRAFAPEFHKSVSGPDWVPHTTAATSAVADFALGTLLVVNAYYGHCTIRHGTEHFHRRLPSPRAIKGRRPKVFFPVLGLLSSR
jgi:hypothetical protein